MSKYKSSTLSDTPTTEAMQGNGCKYMRFSVSFFVLC